MEKSTVLEISLVAYYDKLEECERCVYQLECRGPSVFEPWCPENSEFEFISF